MGTWKQKSRYEERSEIGEGKGIDDESVDMIKAF